LANCHSQPLTDCHSQPWTDCHSQPLRVSLLLVSVDRNRARRRALGMYMQEQGLVAQAAVTGQWVVVRCTVLNSNLRFSYVLTRVHLLDREQGEWQAMILTSWIRMWWSKATSLTVMMLTKASSSAVSRSVRLVRPPPTTTTTSSSPSVHFLPLHSFPPSSTPMNVPGGSLQLFLSVFECRCNHGVTVLGGVNPRVELVNLALQAHLVRFNAALSELCYFRMFHHLSLLQGTKGGGMGMIADHAKSETAGEAFSRDELAVE
jgi:hypothetical protein